MRTATNATINTAIHRTALENPGIVKGFVWLTMLDDRVCPICVALERNGFCYPVDEVPQWPAHRRCRCRLQPCFYRYSSMVDNGVPEAKQLSRARAEEDLERQRKAQEILKGQTPKAPTMNQILRDSPAIAREVLGDAKAAMFARGEPVFPRELEARPPLTLDELRKRRQSRK